MQPLFIGTSARRLFAVHHAPSGQSQQRGAVVCCQPFGQEYVRAHRSIRELAQRLASCGLDVLRFDYGGTGDSAGDGRDETLAGWLEDLRMACEEARATNGVRRVILIGLRLGASLGLEYAARDGLIDRLVLWDPIVDGAAYLAELDSRHREFVASHPRPAGYDDEPPLREIVGFPMPAAMRRELESLDLRNPAAPADCRVLIVSTDAEAAHLALRDRLAAQSTEVAFEHLPGPQAWVRSDFGQPHVPIDTIRYIASWLSEAER